MDAAESANANVAALSVAAAVIETAADLVPVPAAPIDPDATIETEEDAIVVVTVVIDR